jgi:hypothetical protein
VEVTGLQSRFLELQSIAMNSIRTVATVDWETTDRADVLQRDSVRKPAPTYALELVITPLPGTNPVTDLRNIRVDGIGLSARLELADSLPTTLRPKLRLRYYLSQAVNIPTLPLAVDDPRTQFTISGLPAGTYRLQLNGLNQDNGKSGGSAALGFDGVFQVSAIASSPTASSFAAAAMVNPSGSTSTVDDLFSREDEDLFY